MSKRGSTKPKELTGQRRMLRLSSDADEIYRVSRTDYRIGWLVAPRRRRVWDEKIASTATQHHKLSDRGLGRGL